MGLGWGHEFTFLTNSQVMLMISKEEDVLNSASLKGQSDIRMPGLKFQFTSFMILRLSFNFISENY